MRSLGLTPKWETGWNITDGFRVVVVAETSLYIPGFDEEPVSVTALGVDSEGRTTWELVPGKPTGTVSPIDFPVTGKFTCCHSSHRTLLPISWVGGVFSFHRNSRNKNCG